MKTAEAEPETRQNAKVGFENEKAKSETGFRTDSDAAVTEVNDGFSDSEEGLWAWMAVFGG